MTGLFIFINRDMINKLSKIKLFIVLISIVVIVGIGYWLISSLFIDKRVQESVEEIMGTGDSLGSNDELETVRTGQFIDADNFHKSEGTATLLKIGKKYFIRLEDNFKTTNGPDLYVYFGKNGQYDSSAQLGRLKGNMGSQNYEVPAEIDPMQFDEVWIWCRAFSVAFGHAKL